MGRRRCRRGADQNGEVPPLPCPLCRAQTGTRPLPTGSAALRRHAQPRAHRIPPRFFEDALEEKSCWGGECRSPFRIRPHAGRSSEPEPQVAQSRGAGLERVLFPFLPFFSVYRLQNSATESTSAFISASKAERCPRETVPRRKRIVPGHVAAKLRN